MQYRKFKSWQEDRHNERYEATFSPWYLNHLLGTWLQSSHWDEHHVSKHLDPTVFM